ncbi:MAG: hypothetical protein IJD21_09910 [Oscillospiraceae bacterium]|nr:hypothetical protein [Oscillospiraceae bacterium]
MDLIRRYSAGRDLDRAPDCFRDLLERGLVEEERLLKTEDGFWTARVSLSDLLKGRGITAFHNDRGEERRCDLFFDDWYLYALKGESGWICSLYKLREQEHELEQGLIADGDTPGVTVCFIRFDERLLLDCLRQGTEERMSRLNREIDRVVARQGQRHDPALKAYFISPNAQAPYLIARLYVRHLASFAREGSLMVPDHYRRIWALSQEPGAKKKTRRLPDFIRANNQAAGRIVCDQERIFLTGADSLSVWEELALLATHTGNVSFHSFAAEIRYHAQFLTALARIPVPVLGKSVYASAIRADMTIDDNEFEGPAPFYRLDSPLVLEQLRCHPEE